MRISGKTNLAAMVITILALPSMILARPAATRQEKTTAAPATSPQTKTAPRPNPDAAGIYHFGDGVTAPKLLYSAEPEFSEKARKLKIAGCSTTLKFIVETDGHVRDVQILKSCADTFKDKKDREAAQTLDPQAAKAVSQYRFEPAKFQDHPVPVELKVEVQFQVF